MCICIWMDVGVYICMSVCIIYIDINERNARRENRRRMASVRASLSCLYTRKLASYSLVLSAGFLYHLVGYFARSLSVRGHVSLCPCNVSRMSTDLCLQAPYLSILTSRAVVHVSVLYSLFYYFSFSLSGFFPSAFFFFCCGIFSWVY